MKVEKAVFGQVGQGHGLRSFSSKEDFFKRASQWLDIPDVVPSGVNFSPYISGFSLEDQYVISRTFLDVNASRSGMVVAYALAVSIDEITFLNDINKLLELLPGSPCNEKNFSSQCVILNSANDLAVVNGDFSYDVAELLVDKRDGPVIHVGLSGFEELVASIWEKLWPSMRKNFIFRLSLSPRDCVEPALPSLVCIPESLVSRWNNNYKIIGRAQNSESLSVAAQAFFAGYSEFNDFVEKFGIELKNPSMLGLLVQAQMKYTIKLSGFADCLSLVRLVEVLSPENIKGCNNKKALISRLENLIRESKIDEILKLRNLKGSGFSTIHIIWNAIELKVMGCQFSIQNDISIIAIISNSFGDEKAVGNWRQAVKSGFTRLFSIENSSFYSAIWRWLNHEPQVTIQLLSYINITPAIESLLENQAPNNISKEAEEYALPFFAENNLLQLHGLVLGLCYSAYNAFSKQLKIDRDISFTKGLEALANRLNPGELLQSCLAVNDQRVTGITVDKAVVNPLILSEVSFSSSQSLSIWARVLAINLDVWNVPQKSQEILFSLLDEFVISGCSDHIELVRLLSKTPISDLCEFSKRSSIWNLLDSGTRDNYLNQTALGWYRRALELNFVDLDDQLEKAIYIIPGLGEKMKRNSLENTQGVLGVFSRIRSFSEFDFTTWLVFWIDSVRGKSNSNMEATGRFIQEKHWKRAAALVFTKYRFSAQDIRFILNFCKELLPFWDRLSIGQYKSDEKWEVLINIVQELYPSGPEEQEIWSRSRGKRSDLWSSGSGLERWGHAVDKIRNGAKPLAMDLICEIRSDFPNNEKVVILEEMFKD
jgi:hypothetical protein